MAAMTQRLTPADHERIAAAVAQAEARTSGEIMCVLTEEVSAYREVALGWAAAAALLVPPLAFFAGAHPLTVAEALGGWSIAQSPAAEARIALALTLYALAQATLFAAALLLFSAPPVRRALTPGALKDRRVHRAAFRHFVGTGLHLRPETTGVLIFASIADRRMEVIADEAIHRKVGQGAWDEVVAQALAAMRQGGPADGLARAVALCGELLARHFPDDGRPNAFPDRPLEV
jgi:putative membrane protein